MSEAVEFNPEEVVATLEAAVAAAEEEEINEAVSEEVAEEIEEILQEEEEKEELEQEEDAEVEAAVQKLEQEFAEEESEEESDYDDDDFDPADETLYERFEALKDIFSPKQREIFTNLSSNIKSASKSLTLKLGSSLWYVATTSMLIGVPLAIAILNETQLTELEKELTGAGLGPGAAAPSPAPATEEAK